MAFSLEEGGGSPASTSYTLYSFMGKYACKHPQDVAAEKKGKGIRGCRDLYLIDQSKMIVGLQTYSRLLSKIFLHFWKDAWLGSSRCSSSRKFPIREIAKSTHLQTFKHVDRDDAGIWKRISVILHLKYFRSIFFPYG
jgi:hypothetical protein